MATGCDVSESDVTGINVIRPKVGDYPWGVILIVRSAVWYCNGVFYHVRVLTTVIRNGTFCTTTTVRKKKREYAKQTSGYDVTSGHVTFCDVISGQGRFR
jgi:hypothetical protein